MGTHLGMDRPEEQRWGCATALRAGERVLVSGLTAASAAQFRQVMEQAGEALGRLQTSLADVVRTRVFHTRPQDRPAVGAAHREFFEAIRPAASLTQVHFLPEGAELLVEIEAVRGCAGIRKGYAPDAMGGAGLVQVGEELWLAGITAAPASGEMDGQSRAVAARMLSLLEGCGGRPGDVVSTRTYTPVAYVPFSTGPQRLPLSLMHPGHPTAADIAVQGVGSRDLGLLIEAEAVLGAAHKRRNLNTGRPYEEERHYSRAVRVGEVVYVSGCTSVQLSEEVAAPFDAYGQTLETLKMIRWSIEGLELPFADLARLRGYAVGEENLEPMARAFREVLGAIAPAVTAVGVPALGRPSILVEIEAIAVRGAGSGALTKSPLWP